MPYFENFTYVLRWILVLGLVLSLGCSGITPEIQLAEELVQDEEWDQAVSAYREALRQDPFNDELLATYKKVKARAAEEHFLKLRTPRISLMVTGQHWSIIMKRDREAELLFRGTRIKVAIERYAADYEVQKATRPQRYPACFAS